VVTVHDLAILRFPEAFARWHRQYGRAGLRNVLRAATAVVAVSEFTRDEVVALAGVAVDRVRVVPNGVDAVFTADGPQADGDYVLAVATLEPRKNLARAVEAARLAGVELRVIGARGGRRGRRGGSAGARPRLAAHYRRRSSSTRRCTRLRASGARGDGVWRGGDVVRMRWRVAGGAAVLVDPLSPESIAAGIAEASARRDDSCRSALRASQFTWSAAADAVRRSGGARVNRRVVVDADVWSRAHQDETCVLTSVARPAGRTQGSRWRR
jgi:hypothetical protein